MAAEDFVHDVEAVIAVYERLIGGYAGRTRQMIADYGYEGALSRLVNSSEAQKGFKILRDSGRLEESFEAVVLRHPDEFRPEVVEGAQWRLDNADKLG